MSIHPTAIVDKNATIGSDVSVGAFSYIGPHVALGDGCIVHHHATIDGYTTLGARCEVYPQAVLGMPPQDLKYRGERTTLEIGEGNTFREMVTVHPGTGNGGGVTRIGSNNLFLIGVHVAHDCRIGSHCVIANYVQFAGHVCVEDHVNMGGHSALHHFVTVGKHAFVGGMTRVVSDAPPFMVITAARGTRCEVRMVNGVGLQRCGYSHEDLAELKKTFLDLYSRRARLDPSPIRDRVKRALACENVNPHVRYLCEFLMRSFDYGRHGRYLESLRNDRVHRNTWTPNGKHNLTITVVGGGTVERIENRSDEVAGEVMRLTAAPHPGWEFSEWNGCLTGSSNPARLVLDGDKEVTATFKQQQAAAASGA